MTMSPRGPSLSQARAHAESENNNSDLQQQHHHDHSQSHRLRTSSPHRPLDHQQLHHQHQVLPRLTPPPPSKRQAPEADASSDLPGTANPVESLVAHIVQTVSLVQVVDRYGDPVGIETILAEPETVLVDTVSGATVSVGVDLPVDLVPTSTETEIVSQGPTTTPGSESSPESTPDSSPDSPTPSDGQPQSTAPPAAIASSEGPFPSQDESLTSTPSSDVDATPSPLPTSGSGTNSTDLSSLIPSSLLDDASASSLLALGDISILASFSSSAASSASASASSASALLASSFDSSDTSTSTSDSSISSVSSGSSGTASTRSTTSTTLLSPSSGPSGSSASTASASSSASFIGAGGNGEAEATATPTGSASQSDSDETTPETGVIVGGVIGGLAGVALLAFLVLVALRWKKRRMDRIALGDDVGRGGMLTGGARGPASGGGEGSGMAQRSFMLGPGALAAAGAKRSSRRDGAGAPAAEASESGERGFYRVSGRKLPPVLQSGGDGYTDPREGASGQQFGGASAGAGAGAAPGRESAMSDESFSYRDSHAFFDDPDQPGSRLALGSPMRPVSGVPIMRSGPARTPVTEPNPFADPVSPPSSPPRWAPTLQPPHRKDAIGRTLSAHDGSRGSRGSGSRFMEDIR